MNLFHRNLILVFKESDCRNGRKPTLNESSDYINYVSYLESTFGWFQALEKTATETNSVIIINHWNKLHWFESDQFDAILGGLLVEYGIIEEGIPYDENDEYEEHCDFAKSVLLNELKAGEESARKDGYVSFEDIKKAFEELSDGSE
jgi:hypothetical protein